MKVLLTPGRFGAPLGEKQALWASLYEARLNMFGVLATLLPMGDPNHEAVDRKTVVSIGDQQVTWTYSQSQAVTAFDTPPSFEGPLQVPKIHFNGTDEWLETPDAAFWNDTAGSNEPSYFWAMWVEVVAGAAIQTLWAKTASPNTTGTDWLVRLTTTEKSQLRIFDDSANAYIGQEGDDALSAAWHHIAFTKHDDAATSASILTYVDGVLVADTVSEAGSYVAQEDGTAVVRIGAETDDGSPVNSPLGGGPLGPLFIPVGAGTVPTADVVLRDYQLGRAALGV